MTAPVVHRTCEIETSRVSGVIAASNAASVRSSSPSSPASTNATSTPYRSRSAYSGPVPPACSWAVVTARPPARQSGSSVAAFMPSVVAWVSATASTSVPRTAATPARASAMRASDLDEVVGVGAPDVALVGRHVGHRRGRLGGQRPDRAGVQVDARGQGRDAPPGRPRSFSGSGRDGDDHGRMIPAMSGLARPEILATTEWLAENLGQPAIRVLDLPLASRRQRAGGPRQRSHPGRRAGRLAGRPRRRRARTARRSCWPAPTGSRALAVRTGITDDTTVVVYDDTQSLFAARAWWSLRAYGLESVRVLDGGYPDWVERGPRGVERGGRSRARPGSRSADRTGRG